MFGYHFKFGYWPFSLKPSALNIAGVREYHESLSGLLLKNMKSKFCENTVLYVVHCVTKKLLKWVIRPGCTSHLRYNALFVTTSQRLQWQCNYTRKSITRILNQVKFSISFHQIIQLFGEKMSPTIWSTSSTSNLRPNIQWPEKWSHFWAQPTQTLVYL